MDNFFTAIKPYKILAQILGCVPVSAKDSKKGSNFKTKSWNILIPFIWISILVLVFPQCSQGFKIILDKDSKVLPRAWKIVINLRCFLSLIKYIYQLTIREKFMTFLNELSEIDKKVCKISMSLLTSKIFFTDEKYQNCVRI